MLADHRHCAAVLSEDSPRDCVKFATTVMAAGLVAGCRLPIDSLMHLTNSQLLPEYAVP